MKQESLLVKFIALWQVLHLSGGPVVSFLYQKWKEKGAQLVQRRRWEPSISVLPAPELPHLHPSLQNRPLIAATLGSQNLL